MAGVEIHAQLLENIFDADLLSRPRAVRWAEVGVLLAGGLLLVLMMPRVSALTSVAMLVVLVGAIVEGGNRALPEDRASCSTPRRRPWRSASCSRDAGRHPGRDRAHRQALRRQVEQQQEAAARLAGELEAARRIQMGSLPDAATAFPGETRFDLTRSWSPPARSAATSTTSSGWTTIGCAS